MKTRLCFVVDTLANHGAERFLFEVLKAINKDKFTCTVYSTRALSGFETHYQKPIEQLGIKVIFHQDDIYPHIKSPLVKKINTSITYRSRLILGDDYIKEKVKEQKLTFLRGFDNVIIIKWEVYHHQRSLFDQLPRKTIHVLSVNSQYPESPFKIPPTGKTTFILMSENEKRFVFPELQNVSKADKFQFHYLPLLISESVFSDCYQPASEEFRMGIFSRISKDQPTLFALYLIHLLKYENINAKLYFYGKHYDESFFKFYQQTALNLRINHDVEFKGHTFSIKDSINNDGLSLGIMNNASGFIGYSSIELIAAGLPLVFFNIDEDDFNETNEAIEGIYNSINKLKDGIVNYTRNSIQLKELAKNQKNYINKNHLAHLQVKKLEEFYSAI
jgi:hypothetical protein